MGRIAGARWQIDLPQLCSFSSFLPGRWSAGALSPLDMSVCVPCPDEQHCVHHGSYTAVLTGIILPLRPFLNSQATHYRLSIFSEKLHTTTFFARAGCVYRGALDNRLVKSPELPPLRLHQLLQPFRLCQWWENSLGKQTNCYNNSGVILCDLAFAVVWISFQESNRKDMLKVAFMYNLEYSGFDLGFLEVKGCCVNLTTSSLAKSENPGS